MLDKTRKYGEIGYNTFGIKYTQDGKLYRLDGSECDDQGRPVRKPYPEWAAPELFEDYGPELPISQPREIDIIRGQLDSLGISWHPNAKLETLQKRLEAAR